MDNQPEIYGTASDKRWGEKASSTIEWLLNLTYDINGAKYEPEVIYGKWSVQANKQASKHTHARVQWSHASVGLAQALPNKL